MQDNWSGVKKVFESSSSLASGSVIKGIVFFKGNTTINCLLEGDLSCDAKLVVSKESKIRANIKSLDVVVYGQVIGDITAENLIELHPGARVTGNIKAKRVAMHEGVNFDGKCEMITAVNTKVVKLNESSGDLV